MQLSPSLVLALARHGQNAIMTWGDSYDDEELAKQPVKQPAKQPTKQQSKQAIKPTHCRYGPNCRQVATCAFNHDQQPNQAAKQAPMQAAKVRTTPCVRGFDCFKLCSDYTHTGLDETKNVNECMCGRLCYGDSKVCCNKCRINTGEHGPMCSNKVYVECGDIALIKRDHLGASHLTFKCFECAE